MREKILLLYENDEGKALCDAASRVLAQVAVAFGHTFILAAMPCDAKEDSVSDAVLDACAQGRGVLCGNEKMRCLPDLARELLCTCRVRELRYAHLCENRSLMGRENALHAVIVQALSAEPAALKGAAMRAYALSKMEDLPILHTPPTGRLMQDWQAAVEASDSLSAPYHAREVALPEVIPELIRQPAYAGVVLCPPYAGGVIAPAAAALCGAPGMGFDCYDGGQCALYAALGGVGQARDAGDNPFGLLRAAHRLLRDVYGLQREADCLEAALRNVLQAGWRTADIALPASRLIDASGIAGLICQQLEVAGAWIGKQ